MVMADSWEEPMTETHFVPGASPAMRPIEFILERLAQSDDPIVISGEQGTGKHALAFRIHQLSARLGHPFCEVHCERSSPETLWDSAEKQAALGSVFLNDVADLPREIQARILERYFCPDADRTRLPRLLFSTCRNLEQLMRSGGLIPDLYYGITGVVLQLPPLRHRKEDLPGLIDYYLRYYAESFGRPTPSCNEESMSFLIDHHWPGNLDELKTAVKMIVAVGDQRITLAALRAAGEGQYQNGSGRQQSLKQTARAASRRAEQELILDALRSTGWNRKRAAQQLQISYKALLYKLKQIHDGKSRLGTESL